MKVRATKTAFYGGNRIREGQTINIPEGAKLAKWMVPDGKEQPKARAEPEPDTFSAITKAQAKANKWEQADAATTEEPAAKAPRK